MTVYVCCTCKLRIYGVCVSMSVSAPCLGTRATCVCVGSLYALWVHLNHVPPRRDDEVINEAPVLAESLIWLLADAGVLYASSGSRRLRELDALPPGPVPTAASGERDLFSALCLLMTRCVDSASPSTARPGSSSRPAGLAQLAPSSPPTPSGRQRGRAEAAPSSAGSTARRPASASPMHVSRGTGSAAANNLAYRAMRVLRRLLQEGTVTAADVARRGLLHALLQGAAGVHRPASPSGGANPAATATGSGSGARALRTAAADTVECLFCKEESSRTLAARGPPPGVVDSLLKLIDAGVASTAAGGGPAVAPQAARALASVLIRWPTAFDECIGAPPCCVSPRRAAAAGRSASFARVARRSLVCIAAPSRAHNANN